MSTAPDGGRNGVLVSLEAIYDQLIRLAARVDAVLGRHERIEQQMAEHDAELRPLAGAADRLTDHEARLRQLERGRWPVTSLTVLVGIASVVVAILALTHAS